MDELSVAERFVAEHTQELLKEGARKVLEHALGFEVSELNVVNTEEEITEEERAAGKAGFRAGLEAYRDFLRDLIKHVESFKAECLEEDTK